MALEDDPVISEVREARRRISERFGHDPQRLVAYYMQKQQSRNSQPLVEGPIGEDTAKGHGEPRDEPATRPTHPTD